MSSNPGDTDKLLGSHLNELIYTLKQQNHIYIYMCTSTVYYDKVFSMD